MISNFIRKTILGSSACFTNANDRTILCANLNFLRSRAELVADHLRDCIRRGELSEPLPGTRAWCQQLGIARKTLDAALRILRHEGLVKVHARGHQLNREARPRKPGSATATTRLVHLLYYSHDYPNLSADFGFVFLLSEKLQAHEIQLRVERCSDARLRAIADGKSTSTELFFLAALAPRHQQLFAGSGKPSFIFGSRAPCVPLPYLAVDQAGGVAHGTRLLLRHGFAKINLLVVPAVAPGFAESVAAFESACKEWPHQPVHGKLIRMPAEESGMLAAVRRFAERVGERKGVLVIEPVAVGMVLTALLERGIRVPQQVEVVSVLPSPLTTRLCPPISFYQPPIRRIAKELTDIALHFFESGRLPQIEKRVSLQLVAGTAADAS